MSLNFHLIKLTALLSCMLFAGRAMLHAQVLQSHRYELDQKNSDDYFNVINLKEEGIALFREREKFKSSNRIWQLVLLDTDLKEKKSFDLEIKERNKMVGYEVAPGYVYFLFRVGETTKNDFELIEVPLSDGEPVHYLISPDLDYKLTHFIKVGKSFAFGGYVNSEPAVIIYELATKHSKVVPGFFQKDTELMDLRANLNNTFNAVLTDRATKGNRNLIFRTFDHTGKMLMDDIVPIDEARTLQTGVTSTLEREDLVVLGTWGERNSKQSNGFYSLTVDPFSDQQIRFISFGQLDHYLDYLNPKRAERLKEEAREASEQKRIPNYTNYVMPFKIAEHKEGFILLAEVYSPTSGNLNTLYGSPYGASPYAYNPYGMNPYWPGMYYPGMNRMYRSYPYSGNTRANDETKTSEAVLVAYDQHGTVLWDHSIKMDDLKMPSLDQVSDFVMYQGKIYLIFKKESELKIKSVVLKGNEISEISEKIKTMDPVDEVRSDKEQEGGVKHWFDNNFYVWGYQTVRNVARDDRSRDVFYINKVVVP